MLSSLVEYGHKVRVIELPRGPVPLHCMAISAGYEKRANEVYSWDGLQRGDAPFLVLQHTVAGQGRLDYAGVKHVLKPGQTMLLALPHAHRYWLERGQTWEYFWMVLHGREAMRLAHEVIRVAGPVLDLSQRAVSRLAGVGLALIRDEDATAGEVSASAYTALTTLYDSAFTGSAQALAALPPAISRAIAFIEGNLHTSLGIDRLASVASLSRAHFVRQFSAATGVPPSRFVLERRMERVRRLLLATDMNVIDIAKATGFANANYLAKAFRREHQLAPLQYRSAGYR